MTFLHTGHLLDFTRISPEKETRTIDFCYRYQYPGMTLSRWTRSVPTILSPYVVAYGIPPTSSAQNHNSAHPVFLALFREFFVF